MMFDGEQVTIEEALNDYEVTPETFIFEGPLHASVSIVWFLV